MHREINTPDEIIRRLFFVFYLLVVVVFLIATLLGLLQRRYDYLLLAFAGGMVVIVIRRFGKRYLEFERLATSFPCGGEEDAPPPELCREVAQLLAEASSVAEDWQHRQVIRKRLILLLDQNPELWQWFRQEIAAVFPALAHWAGKGNAKG